MLEIELPASSFLQDTPLRYIFTKRLNRNFLILTLWTDLKALSQVVLERADALAELRLKKDFPGKLLEAGGDDPRRVLPERSI